MSSTATRTTITLDEDVLKRAKQFAKKRDISFRQALNELVRTGLLTEAAIPQTVPNLSPARSLGFYPGINYDNTEALLTLAEGEEHR